jgi:PAS domain S-box-containing protein
VSKETEAGFIVISLSETKLGSIYMMSDLALNLFKYNRKDIIGRNVSNVMPIVFANNHDNILIDFLKKKRRTFNTDLRLLLGRDSNGFIFPVHLQLQKASYSANDEFIFIAMVRADKLRSAPLYCLLDHEGYIR